MCVYVCVRVCVCLCFIVVFLNQEVYFPGDATQDKESNNVNTTSEAAFYIFTARGNHFLLPPLCYTELE